MPLILFIFLLTINCFAEALENPWKLSEQVFEKEGYLKTIIELEKKEQAYLKSNYKNDYLQALGTFYSYVGHYKKAIYYFDRMRGSFTHYQSKGFVPKNYKAVDAVSEIIKLSKNYQAVFLNEAHHIPQHRALTLKVLKGLYDNGFRYFAAETFRHEDEEGMNQRGFPTKRSGYYTVEPVFGSLIREAFKIGYKLIAYEYQGKCDYSSTPELCQNQREEGQAKNLVKKIFKNDPQAKVLVHAGYGHIDEKGGSGTFPWIPMAKYFKKFTELDPLTVDQQTMTEHSIRRLEKPPYRTVIKYFNISRATILKMKNNNELWTGMKGHFDIQVFNPRTKESVRPHWLKNIKGRKKVAVDTLRCNSFPCLVQAFLQKENTALGVPIDQLLFREKRSGEIYLPKGTYILKWVTKNIESIKKIKIK